MIFDVRIPITILRIKYVMRHTAKIVENIDIK